MTIEIHNPELERLLEQRIRAGNFASVEEMLLDALRRDNKARLTSQADLPKEPGQRHPSQAENLVELLASARGLLTDDEIDRCFSRNRSTGRSVDLS